MCIICSHCDHKYKPDISRVEICQSSKYIPTEIANMVSSPADLYKAIPLTPAQGLELPAYIIGALCASGGTFGFIKTGSIPSVTAGVTVGVLVRLEPPSNTAVHADRSQYLVGGYRIQNRQTYGVELALLASIILAGSSIPRALRSQKPLPSGLSLLALYGLYTFGNAYRLQK